TFHAVDPGLLVEKFVEKKSESLSLENEKQAKVLVDLLCKLNPHEAEYLTVRSLLCRGVPTKSTLDNMLQTTPIELGRRAFYTGRQFISR
ncbi:hypothetical protein AaE_003214, partial [Aphanomyces astaci]